MLLRIPTTAATAYSYYFCGGLQVEGGGTWSSALKSSETPRRSPPSKTPHSHIRYGCVCNNFIAYTLTTTARKSRMLKNPSAIPMITSMYCPSP